MLSERKKISFEISENKTIFVIEEKTIYDGDVFISRSKSRTTFEPGSNISGQCADAVNLANLLWTNDVIDNYKKSLTVKINEI